MRRRAAVCLGLLLLAFLAPSAANAAPHGDGGLRGAGKGRPPKPLGTRAKEEASEKQLLEPPVGATATSLAKELGSTGQVDPLTGLGIRNPVCDEPGQIRDRTTRISCEVAGTPESAYPASNYGFDVFIATGVTHPVGDFTAAFVTILNGIWLGLIFVLKLVLSLLGLAFGLNPFAEGETMRHITAAIGSIYARVTDPWLPVLIVCAGIWLAYKGLLRREVAAGVAGTLAAVAMLVAGLWVVQQPRATVGRLASLSDEVALGVIAAPQSGELSRPVGTYAEAMSETWSRLVEVPFAGLDFSDVGWALSRPPPEAVEKSDEKFCEDNGALALLAQLSGLGLDGAKGQCATFARRRYGTPRRVVDLYLRSSPGSAARQALWDYFDNDDRYKPKVAAQGGDGVITRLSMLALFAIGLLGALLLLAWLAIRLFTQAAIAFVLLVAAPFAVLFPLLGESGRRAFRGWGLALLGAVLAKVIYAAFLSIVLLGISVLGSVDGPGGSATGFLLSCAFSWSVFLKRGELIGLLSVGDADRRAGRMAAGGIATLMLSRHLSRTFGGTVQGAAARGVRWSRSRGAQRGEATRATARETLRGSARALAGQRVRDARETVQAFEARRAHAFSRARVSREGAPGDLTAPPRDPRGATPATRPPSASEWRRYDAAKDLLGDAERSRRGRAGDRGGPPRSVATEDRELLRRSRNPADHAHRAGLDRAEFEALRGPDRERAVAAIESATRRDRRRLEVASEPAGRFVGRGRELVERVRQQGGEEATVRREQLQRLRRERRREVVSRRNLSRGA
jgi:hypothetical protein